MTPDPGISPAPGARLAAGLTAISFGLGAGHTIRLTAGSSFGDDDIGSLEAAMPASFNVTLSEPVAHLAAWVTGPGPSHHTYAWSYSVGAATAGDQAEFEDVMTHLVDNWTRSALAGYDAPEIPDPGHGRDEICPVTFAGQPFDVGQGLGIAPFTAAEVREQAGSLTANLQPLRDPEVVSPGEPAEYRQDMILEIEIRTPSGRADLANLYAGALQALFSGVTLRSGDQYTRNLTSPGHASFEGDDGTYRHSLFRAPLARFYRRRAAGAQ